MPRKRLITQPSLPYHVTGRSHNREWFKVSIDELWTITSNYLFFISHAFEFKIHSFVLMNNHFHMLVTTPQSNLPEGMRYFMREVSRSISYRTGDINQNFGGPYHWCLLDSYYYYVNAYKYVYRNPVEANLCHRCEDYPYSSLPGILGQSKITFPMMEDSFLLGSLENQMAWLNYGQKEDFIVIGKALKKQNFRYDKHPENGKPVRDAKFIY